ncbi:hypothetical protein [Neisseria elongata]|jgi:hypothetical protein|uniref:hypothetical protein n=1 Tax=Neisseria elongata TaxID=495 RepID=UPI0006663639|nr:hypothetical protein [Neisseria elongata]
MSDPIQIDAAVSDLYFDPENPRFAALSFDKSDECAVIRHMNDEESLIDLLRSIADAGYFSGEPLLVYRNRGRLIVAEGNRRLSALKVLNNPDLLDLPSVREIADHPNHRPETVPCIEFARREDILVYLGYKHITGTKSWGSLEKAIYLNQLKNMLLADKPDLQGQDDAVHKMLARQIGSQSPTVAKTLAAYKIFERGKEREAKTGRFFDIQGLGAQDIDFSLIYTALGYESIYTHLGLSASSDVAQQNFNEEGGQELIRWLFKEDEKGRRVVSDSRRLKELSRVLKSGAATARLRETGDLELAFRLSDGYIAAFDKALDAASGQRKELERLLDEIKRSSSVQQPETMLVRRHADDLEDLGRKFRDLADDVERIIRNYTR